MSKIISSFNGYKSQLIELVKETGSFDYIRYIVTGIITILLFIAVYEFISYLQSKNIGKNIQDYLSNSELKDRIKEEERAELKSIYGEMEYHGLMEKIRAIINYSGLPTKYKWLTTDIVIVANVIISLVVIAAFSMMGSMFLGVLTAFLMIMFEKIIFEINGKRRDRKIESEMINLMPLIRNYSISSGNISTVLQEVKGLVSGPLRDELDRYCSDIERGDTEQKALESMVDRIGSSQTRLVFRDIQSVSKFETDYNTVIELCETQFQNFLQDKREKRKIRTYALIETVALIVMSIVCVTMVTSITSYSNFLSFVNSLDNSELIYVIMIVVSVVGLYIIEDKLIKEVL